MLVLIAIWALAEAILFVIVADVPIMALGIRAGVKKALVGAGVAAGFAAVGGAAVWLWASTAPEEVIAIFVALPGIDSVLVERVFSQWDAGGVLAMTMGSFSGVPYKLYALAAGTGGGEWGALALFMLASVAARLPRFVLVALVSGWAGPRLIARFGPRVIWSVFVGAWILFYAIYWSAMGA